MITTTELWDDAALTSLIAGATLLGADLKVGLFTNTPAIGKQLVIADLTEPTYPGYARQVCVLGAPFRDQLRGIAALAPGLQWAMDDDTVPTIVTGVFYTYGAGPALLGVEMIDPPIPLVDALSQFTTVLEYVQSPPAASLTTILQ